MRLARGAFARVLYANPLCVLTASHGGARNAMALTWLTPTDNHVRRRRLQWPLFNGFPSGFSSGFSSGFRVSLMPACARARARLWPA